ncbi:MAG: UDP-N-acetylglucosamine 1-carboxyvinyltransferase [Lachnospiraceae bacterium]|nr:UDP-N-acetylglucosamine 1-carboxyvinyltransferase [Lachnospiraceae bacterium]
MKSIRIWGGRPLGGTVSIQGSKNATLPIMAAAVLHKGITVLHNCPKIADVLFMEKILTHLGAKVCWKGNSLHLDCSSLKCTNIPDKYACQMRCSIILLGALLGRFGKGAIAPPGGCVIGKRPVDLHVSMLEAFGARIEEKGGVLKAYAPELKGGEFCFPKQSVGATEHAMIAAALAKGVAHLKNCAREPEIIWLAEFLNGMGASVEGAQTGEITIRGVNALHDSEFYTPPDRIVAGTYLCAAAITRGKIVIENPPVKELPAFLGVYGKMGGQYDMVGGKLVADGSKAYGPVSRLETEVFPGFSTDLQSPVMAVLSLAHGKSHIRENIFEDRFRVAEDLIRMGARIRINGKDAYIDGTKKLYGCPVTAQELRGGAALILAGLAAQGQTRIDNFHLVERGYERIQEDIRRLGGNASVEEE